MGDRKTAQSEDEGGKNYGAQQSSRVGLTIHMKWHLMS
jgi:hypothetical protein